MENGSIFVPPLLHPFNLYMCDLFTPSLFFQLYRKFDVKSHVLSLGSPAISIYPSLMQPYSLTSQSRGLSSFRNFASVGLLPLILLLWVEGRPRAGGGAGECSGASMCLRLRSKQSDMYSIHLPEHPPVSFAMEPHGELGDNGGPWRSR